jgi:hypothetical protein
MYSLNASYLLLGCLLLFVIAYLIYDRFPCPLTLTIADILPPVLSVAFIVLVVSILRRMGDSKLGKARSDLA